jgi:uncharacterized protein (DUF952 family)
VAQVICLLNNRDCIPRLHRVYPSRSAEKYTSRNIPVNFVYKIVPLSSPPPSPLPFSLPPSDLDKEHGFIHLSTAKQILGTLRLVFTDETRVYLLKIDYKKVERDIKWEEGSCVPGATGGICNYDMIEPVIKLYDKVQQGRYSLIYTMICVSGRTRLSVSWNGRGTRKIGMAL